jgi:nucleoid DNA-binding protein
MSKYRHTHIAKGVAKATGLTQAQALDAVRATFELIGGALMNKHEVVIDRFGTFHPYFVTPRPTYNFHTGNKEKTLPQYSARFKQSAWLREGMKEIPIKEE